MWVGEYEYGYKHENYIETSIDENEHRYIHMIMGT